jgi:outer membrane PBP1 activator LpoA protein
MNSRRRPFLPFIACALLIALIFSGCSTTQQWRPPAKEISPETVQAESFLEQGNYDAAAEEFLELAEKSSPPLSEHYLIRAAEAFIHSGDIISAINTADSIDTSMLSAHSQYQLTLLYSQIDISMGKPEQALERLDKIPVSELDPGFQISYHTLRSNSYSVMGNLIESAHERVLLAPLLYNQDAIEKNNNAIFEGLSLLSTNALEALQPPPPDTLGGWMALVRILESETGDQTETDLAIDEWHQQFPGHPADIEALRHKKTNQVAVSEMPKSIALFLPQSGAFAKAAKAIHKGIISAYYLNKVEMPPTIQLYDTEAANIETLYTTAVADGAQLVIGPLNKKRVLALSQSKSLPIPVLALNQHKQETVAHANFYQFSLSPEDEVEQSAASAWLEGHRTALVLTPASNFGHRLASHFADYWQALGGAVLEAQSYPPKQSDFSLPIQKLLNLDSSKLRYKRIRRLLNRDIKFEPRRRQDADFLFLAATIRNARLIRPQLKFFRASHLPVYASSHLYNGQDNPSQNIDLNGIIFADIPWSSAAQEGEKQAKIDSLRTISKVWGNTPIQEQRLLALGFDAYNVIPQLARLQQSPTSRFNGLSGKLYLDKQNRLHRQLELFYFKRGIAKPLGTAPHLVPTATPPEEPDETGITLNAIE